MITEIFNALSKTLTKLFATADSIATVAYSHSEEWLDDLELSYDDVDNRIKERYGKKKKGNK